MKTEFKVYIPNVDMLNDIIAALATRYEEKAEIWRRCNDAGRPWEAEGLRRACINLKAAKSILEHAETVYVD